MIINPKIHSLLKTYMKQQVKGSPAEQPAPKAGAANGADKTEFSQEGKFLLSLLQTAKDLPEVRPDKVAALREAVKTGTYTVSDDAIAEKILGDRALDKLV